MLNPLDLTNRAAVTPAHRLAEREEIARLTADYERKHGKVQTMPNTSALFAVAQQFVVIKR